jgi:hypothetical protein
MNKENSKNKNKKQDPILDFIFDLDIDLEEDNPELNSTKKNENYENIENSSLVIETKPVNVEPQKDPPKLLKKETINKKVDKPKKYKETKTHKKINKNKSNQEDLELLKKLIDNISTFLDEKDPKNIKEIEDYFYKNLQKKKLKRLLEININDEIFNNNIVFLINGFGYYYNPYKDLIIDFIFPYDIIYFPLIFNEKLKNKYII